MAVNPEIFREYDIRGVAERDLTDEVVAAIGRAFVRYCEQQGEQGRVCIVGRDNRLSSDRVRDGLVAAITAEGWNVRDIGTVTTPMFYYARELFDRVPGLMVTASHNPPEYNGFKVGVGPSTIYGEEIQRLGRMAQEEWAEGLFAGASGRGTAAGPGAGKTASSRAASVEQADISEAYVKMLASKIRLGPRRLKVAVDCGNGTTSLFAERYFRKLGCEVIPLFAESDGRFPNHEPDPVKAKNLQVLSETVRREKADLGVGFDGDGDRIGVVDEQGRPIYGDRLMALFWREILAKHPGAEAIIEVKCSQALVDEVKRLGGRPLFYKTGHSLIKAKMRELGALFAGEMSGHMFFADEYFGFDDAFYAAGRLLRILSNQPRPLSELFLGVPTYHSTAETRVPCPEEAKKRVVGALAERFRRDHEVIDVDGARVIFEDGWGLVRASNTQPVIVARCEGKTPEALERICAVMKEALLSFPEVGQFEWEW